mgnify:CR=1 FL=1
MAKPNNDFKFSIVENIGVLSEAANGWKTELNLVRWGDNEPTYDIRSWSPDHTKCGKGKTFTAEELTYVIFGITTKMMVLCLRRVCND